MSGSVDAVAQGDELSLEEKATNFHTMEHIQLVQKLLHRMVVELLQRAEKHDQSKLVPPELPDLVKLTRNLAGTTFGTKEYDEGKRQMPVGLAHHYANNRHHPEHFRNGVNDMNLIDIMEMLVDWWASSKRHNDGNVRKSIEINAARFGINPQLVLIFENTLDLLEP